MQPASQRNLSFHSSSDCSSYLVYLDGETPLATEHEGWAANTVTPQSDAFQSAASALPTARTLSPSMQYNFADMADRTAPVTNAALQLPQVLPAGDETSAVTTAYATGGTTATDTPPVVSGGNTTNAVKRSGSDAAAAPGPSPVVLPAAETSAATTTTTTTPAAVMSASPLIEHVATSVVADHPTPSSPPPGAPPSSSGPLPTYSASRAAPNATLVTSNSSNNNNSSSSNNNNNTNDVFPSDAVWTTATARAALRRGAGSVLHYVAQLYRRTVYGEVRGQLSSKPPRSSSSVTHSGFAGIFDDIASPSQHIQQAQQQQQQQQRGGPETQFVPADPLQPRDDYDVPLGVQRIFVDRAQAARLRHAPSAITVPASALLQGGLRAVDAVDDAEAEYPNFEVDLVSGLRGYRDCPNEWFAHLVAAALNTRSPQHPVTAAELAEAHNNPYLVRMILNSGCVDLCDPDVTHHVQETVNELLERHKDGADPALYEYLCSFLRLSCVRLTQAQYDQLKCSGFEYIQLMYINRHVLPCQRLYTAFDGYSEKIFVLNTITLIIDLLAIVLFTVALALTVAKWMIPTATDRTMYGFYTLLVYGCGYALQLIVIIFIIRSRQNEQPYEYTHGLHMPSPYVYAVPVLPLFTLMCIVVYVRAFIWDYVILSHNTLVAARVASACFATFFSFPQLVAQSIMESRLDQPYDKGKWYFVYDFLTAAAFIQWTWALLCFAWLTGVYDSIDGFGFARFNIRCAKCPSRLFMRALYMLHFVTVFLLETDIYLIIVSLLKLPGIDGSCRFMPITLTSLSAFSILFILVLFFWLTVFGQRSVRIFILHTILLLIHVTIFVFAVKWRRGACSVFTHSVFYRYFTFGYASHGVYFLLIFFMFLFGLEAAAKSQAAAWLLGKIINLAIKIMTFCRNCRHKNAACAEPADEDECADGEPAADNGEDTACHEPAAEPCETNNNNNNASATTRPA